MGGIRTAAGATDLGLFYHGQRSASRSRNSERCDGDIQRRGGRSRGDLRSCQPDRASKRPLRDCGPQITMTGTWVHPLTPAGKSAGSDSGRLRPLAYERWATIAAGPPPTCSLRAQCLCATCRGCLLKQCLCATCRRCPADTLRSDPATRRDARGGLAPKPFWRMSLHFPRARARCGVQRHGAGPVSLIAQLDEGASRGGCHGSGPSRHPQDAPPCLCNVGGLDPIEPGEGLREM